MKNINKFFAFMLFGSLIACDPLSDVREDLEHGTDWLKEKQMFQRSRERMEEDQIVLEEGDYSLSSNEFIRRDGTFSEEYPATEFMPEILTKKYFGEHVQFLSVIYNEIHESNTELIENDLEFEADDYANTGNTYGSITLGREDESMNFFLKEKLSNQMPGTRQTVQYIAYGTGNRFAKWAKVDGQWAQVGEEAVPAMEEEFDTSGAYELTIADYQTMTSEDENERTPADNNNFSDSVRPSKWLPAFLEKAFNDKNEVTLKYAYFGNFENILTYAYDGTNWERFTADGHDWDYAAVSWNSTQLENSSNFIFMEDAKDYLNTEWISDPYILKHVTEGAPTASYTLKNEDYYFVGEAYPNFDLRYNTNESLTEKIGTALKANLFNQMKVGDIYRVEFATYGNNDEITISSPALFEILPAN
ncbi:hypothetical protein [Persicobacter diffluens]